MLNVSDIPTDFVCKYMKPAANMPMKWLRIAAAPVVAVSITITVACLHALRIFRTNSRNH